MPTRSLLPSAAAALAAVACALLPLASPSALALPPDAGRAAAASEQSSTQDAWREVDRLTSQQQFAAGADKLAALRTALGTREGHEYTRALIRETQLRSAASGEESALRMLRSAPWPREPRWRVVVAFFYARQLQSYQEKHAQELNQRERVKTDAPANVEPWTREQLEQEAHQALADVWRHRDALGNEPIDEVRHYIEPNDYPQDIRSTLRDAVAYLWAEQLVGWRWQRPEQKSAHEGFDVQALVRGTREGASPVRLDDPAVHPLVRASALLDDHEAWHLRSGRPQAALEARLERLRIIHQNLTGEGDRALVRAELERTLESSTGLSWWSMGMAQLAAFHAESGRPEGRTRALAIASACERTGVSSSIGVKRCAHLARSLVAPHYKLEALRNDAPGQHSLSVTHRNLDRLHFRAWRLPSPARSAEAPFWATRDLGHEQFEDLLLRRPDHRWEVELPPTPDLADHRTYVTPPMKRRGLYAVAASTREDFDPRINSIQGVGLALTDLVLVQRADPGDESEVLVLSSSTGSPVRGVVIDLCSQQEGRSGHGVVATATTDAGGRARFPSPVVGAFDVVAHKGDDWAFDWPWRGPRSSPSRGPGARRPAEPTAASPAVLLLTDRLHYRPGEKIFWKAVAYRSDRERAQHQTLPGEPLEVLLRNPDGEEAARLSVRTNGFGSASGAFELPANGALGRWSASTSLGGTAPVIVSEQRNPSLVFSLHPPKTPLELGKEGRLSGEARYDVGLPATGAEVNWKVYPSILASSDPSVEGSDPSLRPITGTTIVDADGHFSFGFVPRGGPGAETRSYHFTVHAELNLPGGEKRAATLTCPINAPEVTASISPAEGFYTGSERAEFLVHRRAFDERRHAGTGRWQLLTIEQPAKAPLPADQPSPAPSGAKGAYLMPRHLPRAERARGYRPEALLAGWADGKLVASGELPHDEHGVGRLTLPKLAPGAYRLRYESTDAHGARVSASRELLVGGRSLPVKLPLLLVAQRRSIRSGETARFLVHSGIPGQPMLLEVRRGGKRIIEQWLTGGRSPALVEFPSGTSERDGFDARLTAVRDYQLMSVAARISIETDPAPLQVELSSFRDRVRPGDKETWRVTVKDARGEPLPRGTVELAASLCDSRVSLNLPLSLAVAAHRQTPRSPSARAFESFHFQEHNVRFEGATFFRGGGLAPIPSNPILRPDRLTFPEGPLVRSPSAQRRPLTPSGHVGSQRPPGSSGPPASSRIPEHLRGLGTPLPLQGHALWQPHLSPGHGGVATLEFVVPDSASLSLWVHAISPDFRTGVLGKEVAVIRDLRLQPTPPPLMRSGERTELTIEVRSESSQALDGQVRLELFDPETKADLLDAFGLGGRAVQPFSVSEAGVATVRFSLDVPAGVGRVAMRSTATAGTSSDGELRVLPILPARTKPPSPPETQGDRP